MLWDNCSAKGAAKEYRAELSSCLFLSFRYLFIHTPEHNFYACLIAANSLNKIQSQKGD